MSERFAGWDERTLDLAIAYVTEGLDDALLAELRAHTKPEDLESFERSTALLQLSQLERLETPPAHVQQRLEAAALEFATPAPSIPAPQSAAIPPPMRPVPPVQDPRPTARVLAFSGWAAAAVLLVAVTLMSRGRATPETTTLRDRLVASAADLIQVDWAGTGDPLGEEVQGDVVWSRRRQEGYMRFRGLEPNDPTVNQYQLWIFDQSRADWEAQPVDGGVFDVDASGEAVVSIDPKLEVRQAALFAITLEKPGGVVVSKRERLLLTATP